MQISELQFFSEKKGNILTFSGKNADVCNYFQTNCIQNFKIFFFWTMKVVDDDDFSEECTF